MKRKLDTYRSVQRGAPASLSFFWIERSVTKLINILIVVSDGGIRRIPTSATERAGAYSVSLTEPDGSTYRNTAVFKDTTNNEMELMGLLDGLIRACERVIKGEPDTVILASDSQIVIKGVMDGGYLDKWRLNNYRKATGLPIANERVWRVLDQALLLLRSLVPVKYYWVRGHQSEKDIEQMTDPLLKLLIQLNIKCDDALSEELNKTFFEEDRYKDQDTYLQACLSHIQDLQHLAMNNNHRNG